MIVGEHSRGNDLEVNVVKGKQLSNVRAAGKEEKRLLTPPIRLSLEAALAYIGDDELVEVTPKSIRLRKAILDPHARKRAEARRRGVGPTTASTTTVIPAQAGTPVNDAAGRWTRRFIGVVPDRRTLLRIAPYSPLHVIPAEAGIHCPHVSARSPTLTSGNGPRLSPG